MPGRQSAEKEVLSLTCDQCGSESKVFTRECDLNKHMKTHNRNVLCPHEGCRFGKANDGFADQSSLKRHIKDKHEKEQIPCGIDGCTVSYSRLHALNVHREEKHGIPRPNQRQQAPKPEGAPIKRRRTAKDQEDDVPAKRRCTARDEDEEAPAKRRRTAGERQEGAQSRPTAAAVDTTAAFVSLPGVGSHEASLGANPTSVPTVEEDDAEFAAALTRALTEPEPVENLTEDEIFAPIIADNLGLAIFDGTCDPALLVNSNSQPGTGGNVLAHFDGTVDPALLIQDDSQPGVGGKLLLPELADNSQDWPWSLTDSERISPPWPTDSSPDRQQIQLPGAQACAPAPVDASGNESRMHPSVSQEEVQEVQDVPEWLPEGVVTTFPAPDEPTDDIWDQWLRDDTWFS